MEKTEKEDNEIQQKLEHEEYITIFKQYLPPSQYF